MGARPSRLRIFYRKAIRGKPKNRGGGAVPRRTGSCASSASTAQLLNGRGGGGGQDEGAGDVQEGEEVMLLGLWPTSNAAPENGGEHSLGQEDLLQFDFDGEMVVEENFNNANGAGKRAAAQALEELAEMHGEMDKMLGAFRAQMERLEGEQRRKLQACSKKWRNSQFLAESSSTSTTRTNSSRKKLESLTEECRLRNALLVDKFRNCTEYLQGFDSLIRSIQREQQKNEDDDFLREFLLKTAKRQHKKGQLSQAVDTFCQLLIATDGRLRCDEMSVLADVCREKVEHTREFHERISGVVRQQMDNSPFVVDELWGSVLEELRAECADAYEIVMRVRPSSDGGSLLDDEEDDKDCVQRKNVEQLKFLLGSTICALWLQITPYGHEEFDEVKELFFRTLDQYMKCFSRKAGKKWPMQRLGGAERLEGDGDGLLLENTVRELLGQYPKLAGTKKMRKIAQRLFCASGAKDDNNNNAKNGHQQCHEPPPILVEY